MSKRLIVPPAAMAVSIEAARQVVRVSSAALDAEITGKVQGFTEDAEHETGRALITQTWEVTLDAFPAARHGGSAAIQLPKAPLASVVSINFYDADGVQQTLDPQDYLVDDKSEPGYVVPAPGLAWPATQKGRINSVEVRYLCGYGPSPDDVPAAIKQYILGRLENAYYQNANAQYLCRLLDRARVYG